MHRHISSRNIAFIHSFLLCVLPIPIVNQEETRLNVSDRYFYLGFKMIHMRISDYVMCPSCSDFPSTCLTAAKKDQDQDVKLSSRSGDQC